MPSRWPSGPAPQTISVTSSITAIAGVQYLAIRYTERLAEEGAVTSVGSKGDSYDNALAETVNGLYKAELIYRRGPWKTIEQVELATAAWVHWWNQRRLHGACGKIPAGRIRSEPLPCQERGPSGRVIPTRKASTEPRAIQSPHM